MEGLLEAAGKKRRSSQSAEMTSSPKEGIRNMAMEMMREQ